MWETLKMGATALIKVFQNIAFGLLGVAAGLPMRTQSHLERPRYIFRPIVMALTGSLTRREAVSSGLPEKGVVCCRILKGLRVATPKRRQALQNKSGKGTARSKP